MPRFNFTFSHFPSVLLVFTRPFRQSEFSQIFNLVILSYSQNLQKFLVHENNMVYSMFTFLLFTCIQEQSPVKEARSQAVRCNSPVPNDTNDIRQLLITKNEKIEFLKDHIDQLVEELHRKSRSIICAVSHANFA